MPKKIDAEPYTEPVLNPSDIYVAPDDTVVDYGITERGAFSGDIAGNVFNSYDAHQGPIERIGEIYITPNLNVDISSAHRENITERENNATLNSDFVTPNVRDNVDELYITPTLSQDFAVAESDQEQRFQIGFTGKLITRDDPVVIGNENYSELVNYRYTDRSLEGVGGTSKVNTYEGVSDTSALDFMNGIAFTSAYDRDEGDLYSVGGYVLMNGIDSSNNNLIIKYEEPLVDNTGEFPFTVVDGSNDLIFQSSEAGSDQTVTITPGSYGGADLAAEIETQMNTNTTLTGSGTITFDVTYSSSTRQFTIDSGVGNTVTIQNSSGIIMSDIGFTTGPSPWVSAQSISSNRHVFQEVYDFSGVDPVRIAKLPNGCIGFSSGSEDVIWAGDISEPAAFLQYDVASDVVDEHGIDITDKISDSTTTEYAKILDYNSGNGNVYFIGSTRPIRRFYINMDDSNVNSNASALIVKYYAGGGTWTDCTITDNTLNATGTVSLNQDGWVNINTPTIASHKPHFLEGYYLYFYRMHITDCDADTYINKIYVDMPPQELKDIWDGAERTAIGVRTYVGGDFTDYTLDVAEASYGTSSATQTVIDTNGMTTSDSIYVYFSEPITALKFKVFGREGSNGFDIAYKKNDGTFAAVSEVVNEWDESADGWVFFDITDPSLEALSSLPTGGKAYVYRMTPDATFTGDLKIDKITGVPRYPSNDKVIRSKHIFPVQFANRAMWCGSIKDAELNRIDYSAPNASDVYNGDSASGMFNERSLYIGGNEALTGASELYTNQIDTMDSVLLLFKNSETYLLSGYNSDTFRVFTISKSIGCPAPFTITSAETAPRDAGASIQNIILWLSGEGPMMYINNTIVPIGDDIWDLFDPSNGAYSLDQYYTKNSRAWFDPAYKEWNLVFPVGTHGTTSTPNKWMVYDIIRNKWYEKDTGEAGIFPVGGFNMTDSQGRTRTIVYGDNGYILNNESGLSWVKASGTESIANKVTTSDFFFTNSIWDQELIRQFEIIYKVNTNGTIDVNYYKDTATSETGGAGLPNGDSMALSGYRTRHMISPMKQVGWTHKFEINTSDCTSAKPNLLGIGVLHKPYRPDKTDSSYMGTITITSSNNNLNFATNGSATQELTLSDGTYTPIEACHELQSKIAENGTLVDAMVYINAGKVELDVGSGNTISFISGGDADSDFGFTGNIGANQTITAQGYITEQVS